MGNLYETDFYAWTQAQADALKRGDLSAADLTNLIEEIETMGRGEKRELASRLEVLLTHLLKWRFQFLMRSNSWRRTINEQRRKLVRVMEESPSLVPTLEAAIARAYVDARGTASDETGIKSSHFPQVCPFTREQIFDPEWFPESE
jgi:hypothetical protein